MKRFLIELKFRIVYSVKSFICKFKNCTNNSRARILDLNLVDSSFIKLNQDSEFSIL